MVEDLLGESTLFFLIRKKRKRRLVQLFRQKGCDWSHRKRRDSNPRTALTVFCFQDRCNRPLCHSSFHLEADGLIVGHLPYIAQPFFALASLLKRLLRKELFHSDLLIYHMEEGTTFCNAMRADQRGKEALGRRGSLAKELSFAL